MSKPSNLSANERIVLGALMAREPDAPSEERTIAAVARKSGLAEEVIRRTLHDLQGMKPAPVQSAVDAKTGTEIWIANHEAIEVLEPPPSP